MSRELVHSDPIKDIYHHKINEFITVIESHNTHTGLITYTMKTKFFDVWREENPVIVYTNVTTN
jgi:hypothetical protein